MIFNLDRILYHSSPGVVVTYEAPDTEITIPYTNDGNPDFCLIRLDTNELVEIDNVGFNTTFTVLNTNLTGVPLVMGVKYTPFIHLSTIFPRDDQDRPMMGGRTNLRYLKLWYDDTREFTVVVAPVGGTERRYTKPATGPLTGEFSVPIHSRNTAVDIYITTTSVFPVTISGYAWEGVYHNRMSASRR